MPITSEPSRCGFAALPAPLVPDGGDHDEVAGVDQPGGDRRGEREGGDGRVAAGDGDPGGAAEQLALAGQLGQAVGPGAGVRSPP